MARLTSKAIKRSPIRRTADPASFTPRVPMPATPAAPAAQAIQLTRPSPKRQTILTFDSADPDAKAVLMVRIAVDAHGRATGFAFEAIGNSEQDKTEAAQAAYRIGMATPLVTKPRGK